MNQTTKNILLIGSIFVIVLFALVAVKNKNNTKFYLTDKYYYPSADLNPLHKQP